VEEASLYGLIQRIVEGDFPSPRAINPELPLAFEELILQAMARYPDKRFADTRALGRALLEFGSGARAQYAEELSSGARVPAAPEISNPSAEPSEAPRGEPSGTASTLRQQLSPLASRSASRTLRWLGAGLVPLVALVGFLVLRRSSIPSPVLARASVAATAPSTVPLSTVPLSTVPLSTPSLPGAATHATRALVSVPAGATVWAGGIERGKAPLSVELPSNAPLEVELRLPGYTVEKRQISKADPEEVRVELKLKPASGTAVKATRPVPPADRIELAPR
jgi:PEGA domain